jgi:hypothetical protein
MALWRTKAAAPRTDETVKGDPAVPGSNTVTRTGPDGAIVDSCLISQRWRRFFGLVAIC